MVDEVFKRIRLFDHLDEKVSKAKRDEIKGKVGELLVSEVNSFLSRVRSPVKNTAFPGLSKDYKKLKRKKGAGTRANLLLSGDMRSQLSFEDFRDGIYHLLGFSETPSPLNESYLADIQDIK